MKKLKYVNFKSVDQLIGEYAPISSKMFADIIDETLINLNQGYVLTTSRGRYRSDNPAISDALVGISDKLLKHNIEGKKKNPWDLYNKLDFDIVHTCNKNASGSKLKTEVKAYFHFTEFSRPESQRRVVFHLDYNNYHGTKWAISFPVQIVMKGCTLIPDGHFGYSHKVVLLDDKGSPKDKEYYYTGVTKRNWLKRMREHLYKIENGANTTFHRTWREYIGRSDVLFSSELITFNHTKDEIMDWEEWEVDEKMKEGVSLNMIPGGNKGMEYLYKHRITSKKNISLEERDEAIELLKKNHPRLGISNSLISELWNNNEEYAQKIICGPEGRFSVDQIRKIRELSNQSISIEEIAKMVDAKNIQQVKRVLNGATYSRIS